MDQKVLPISGIHIATVEQFDSLYTCDVDDCTPTDDLDNANVALSLVKTVSGERKHKVVLDIDHPVVLLPSSTEGHFHLYIDKEIDEEPYFALLEALAAAGLVEEGYMHAALKRGFTVLRLPWIKKDPTSLTGETFEP